ncbi:MAG: hypothetical protein WCI31_06225 [Prolixibacteraceae bacterium]
MKTVTVLFLILIGLSLWFMPRWRYSELQKSYTVKMIFGNSKIGYTSEMQVDSIRWISNQQVLVYVDSHPLSISAAYITFKKN